jgi:hypothetical protein
MERGAMKEWENTLELLRQRGWNYGYVKCLDTETGDENYLVNLSRRIKRLSIVKSTIEEAVTAISRLADEADGMALPQLDLMVQTMRPLPIDHRVAAF